MDGPGAEPASCSNIGQRQTCIMRRFMSCWCFDVGMARSSGIAAHMSSPPRREEADRVEVHISGLAAEGVAFASN